MKNDDNDRLRRLLKSEEETRKDIEPPPASGTTASKKSGATTPRLNLPDLDKDNMPLPKRVDEEDTDGTRVTPAAYRHTSNPQQNQRPVYRLPEHEHQPQAQPRHQTYRQPQDSAVNQFMNRVQTFFSSVVSSL